MKEWDFEDFGHIFRDIYRVGQKVRRSHMQRNISISNLVPGAKVNSEYYCDHVLRRGLLRDIQVKFSRHNWAMQQPENLLTFCIRR